MTFILKLPPLCFSMYLGFTWCRNDISFAAQVIPVLGMKFGKSVWNFIVVSCKLKANFVSDWQYISCKEQRNILEKAFLSLSATSGRKLTNLMENAGTSVIYCKTVGFFLKISKEIAKAWRKSRASLTCPSLPCLALCFQARSRPLTARAYMNKQKYGLFCSLLP